MRNKATREEVEQLKRDWANDPIYEITGIEGFEEYEEELKAFQIEMEGKWRIEMTDRDKRNAERMGVDVDSKLFHYLSILENKIVNLSDEVDTLREQVYHLEIGGRRYGPL